MMPATLGRTFQERTRWTKMASDVHVFLNILTHVITTHVCIPMSQWKSECFSRQPKLNLLQSLRKPSKAWTGCYELICCKARWRSVLEETNCLAKPNCCDFCCCLASVIPAFVFCCVVASFFALERRSPGTNTSSRFGDMWIFGTDEKTIRLE